MTEPARGVAPGGRAPGRKSTAQPSLALGDSFQLPTLDLLARAPDHGRQQIDRAALERNARLLESVLEDFHVRGDIVEVRPGPVVTLYELEPAPGEPGKRAYTRYLEAFKSGLLVRATGDTIALAPPLIIEKSEIDELISVMKKVLKSAN